MGTFPTKRNQSEVIRAFIAGDPGQVSNLLTDGTTIWSYGDHWPLAVKLDEHAAALNADHYSVTTSKHRTMVSGALARAGYAIQDATLREMKGW